MPAAVQSTAGEDRQISPSAASYCSGTVSIDVPMLDVLRVSRLALQLTLPLAGCKSTRQVASEPFQHGPRGETCRQLAKRALISKLGKLSGKTSVLASAND